MLQSSLCTKWCVIDSLHIVPHDIRVSTRPQSVTPLKHVPLAPRDPANRLLPREIARRYRWNGYRRGCAKAVRVLQVGGHARGGVVGRLGADGLRNLRVTRAGAALET